MPQRRRTTALLCPQTIAPCGETGRSMSVPQPPQPKYRLGRSQALHDPFCRLRRQQAAGTLFLRRSPRRGLNTGRPKCCEEGPKRALVGLSLRAVWPMCAQNWTGWLHLRDSELSKKNAERPAARAWDACFRHRIVHSFALPIDEICLRGFAGDLSVLRHLVRKQGLYKAKINTPSPKAWHFAEVRHRPRQCGFPCQGTMSG